MEKINISGFNYSSIVDGPGVRFTIYMQGCIHHCVGCHNPSTWSLANNQLYTIEEIIQLVENEAMNNNITISGGDPLLFPELTIKLARILKHKGYNIWLYTGYTYEQILEDESRQAILQTIDTLVDGKYEQSKKQLGLKYRGSSNQRIINLNENK